MIEIYTDGSCKPSNPGPGGYGFIVIEDGKVIMASSGFLGQSTNNIAEIMGFKNALHALKAKGLEWKEINVMTDSQYVIGMFQKNWNAKANQELVRDVREMLEDFPNLEFKWVKGHDGNNYNEKVDLLAKGAVDTAIAKLAEEK